MGRETAPLMGLMCSDCSEGESSFFTRERRKTGGTNGCWGGHAGVLLGFMHLPSEAASCSSHHKAKATAAKVAERWPSKSCLPASVSASALCERGLGRVSTSPRSLRWPCCQPATARSRGPQLPMFHVRLAWKGSPWVCSDLRAARGRQGWA